MKIDAKFYHAGCPVCQDAEKNLIDRLDPKVFQVESIHLGEDKDRLVAAEKAGVKSVPALVIGDDIFHINFGADLSALK